MQLTQEQCEARMLVYVREYYQTNSSLGYLDDVCAYIVNRVVEDIAYISEIRQLAKVINDNQRIS